MFLSNLWKVLFISTVILIAFAFLLIANTDLYQSRLKMIIFKTVNKSKTLLDRNIEITKSIKKTKTGTTRKNILKDMRKNINSDINKDLKKDVKKHMKKDMKKDMKDINQNISTGINKDINIVNATLIQHSFMKSFLQSAGRTMTIFIHYRGDIISDSLLNSNRWEAGMVTTFENYIKNHPGIQVLDIGCNLGIYTLTAAALGCKVVAIDANIANTDRLMQSLLANNIQNKTIICLNALSNVRKNFVIQLVPSNIGGSGIREVGENSNSVKSIFIDDLLPFFDKDKSVAVKMDIEGNEINALRKANTFFDERNVTFVMMEWEWIKVNKEISYVIQFFTSRHFKAFNNCDRNVHLNVAQYLSWPFDICWLR